MCTWYRAHRRLVVCGPCMCARARTRPPSDESTRTCTPTCERAFVRISVFARTHRDAISEQRRCALRWPICARCGVHEFIDFLLLSEVPTPRRNRPRQFYQSRYLFLSPPLLSFFLFLSFFFLFRHCQHVTNLVSSDSARAR